MRKTNRQVAGKADAPVGHSRRSVLMGATALAAGMVMGRLDRVVAATEPERAPAPSLPWKWTKLDPMEAGSRAYRNYLTNKG